MASWICSILFYRQYKKIKIFILVLIQILFAQPLNPNLREFLFIVEWGNLPTVEELEKRLDYHKLMILCTTSDDLIFTVDLPDHFPPRAHFCVTIINGNYAEISYRRESNFQKRLAPILQELKKTFSNSNRYFDVYCLFRSILQARVFIKRKVENLSNNFFQMG